jgi:hypothetical protein
MGGNNLGGIVLKFGGFQICFDGIQGSSTLFLGMLGVFPFCFSEIELVVPFCLHHLTNFFTKPIITKNKNKNKYHSHCSYPWQYSKLNLSTKILFYTFSIEPMKVFF